MNTRRALSLLAVLSILAPLPRGAHAAISPEARAVVERHLAATGGRAAFDAERAVHFKASISAFGMPGAVESWTSRPDRQVTDVTIGPFRLQDGFDGTVGWRVDQNGKLQILDGKDLEESRSSCFFDNDRWLEPGEGGATVAVVGEERDSTGSYTVLEVTPPGGRARRFWFDRETGLRARDVSQKDQRTVTVAISDYREAAGRRRPFRQVTRVVGMPMNDLTMTVDSVWVNQPVEEARFRPPGEQAAAPRFLKTPGVARLPIHYGGERHVWLKVSINGGPPEDFLYDTGASITVIDSAYAVKYGLQTEGRLQGQGAGAVGTAALSRVASFTVAGPDSDGVELRDQKVGVLSINPFVAPYFWREAAGVLGYDFISRFVNEVDYDAQTLTLYDPKTFRYTGRGETVPITLAGTVPVVRGTLDGRYTGEFRIDVGSNSTLDLHSPFVKRHGLLQKAGRIVEVTGGGFGGTFTNRVCRMKRMQIGRFAWNEPLVGLSGAETGALASEDYAGNIGNRLLERFRCTFDYEHRALYLEPGDRYNKRDRFTRTGCQFARFGDTVRVMSVLKGSAAERAGLGENDEVTAIDGRPVLTWTVDELADRLETGVVGSVVTLEIARGGKRSTVRLRLREML